jgi:hypothetical protein
MTLQCSSSVSVSLSDGSSRTAAAKRKEMTMKRLCVFIAVTAMSSASAYAQQAFTFGTLSNFIQVKHGLCLIAMDDGRVVQGSCASDPTQWWKVVPAPSDPAFFTIQNGARCLDVPVNADPPLGKNLQVFECHGRTNQQFRLTARGGGEWQIQPKQNSSLCLDIEGGSSTPGAPLQLYTCKSIDVDNQRFLLRPQTQQPRTVDCSGSNLLRLRWTDHLAIPSTQVIALFQGDAGHFRATGFSYWCTPDPADFSGSPDGAFFCPVGTRTVEVARNGINRFRVKCAI